MIAVSCVFLFASCKTLNGKLEVLEDFTLKTKDGELKLSEGEKNAKVTVKSKRTVVLKVNGEKVKLKLPKGEKFPAVGSFEFGTDITGQEVAISGDIDKEVSYGQRRTYPETCSESRALTRCYNGFCERRYVTVHGTRLVTYQDKTVEEFVTVNFDKEDSVVAKFDSRRVSRSSHVVDYGFCNIARRGFYRGRWYYRF